MTRRSHLPIFKALPVLACLAAAAAPLRAQEPAPTAEPSPAPSPTPAPPSIDVIGFVDAYYLYNFNKTAPALRSFDVQHNAFSLSLAEVAFQKSVTPDSRGGFRADLDFGKTADLVAAYEPEGSDGKEIYKHIQQAYVSFLATPKLQLDYGKFATIHGAEVIESKDNWNYGRSALFGYAIPFYHTGLRATYTASDKATVVGVITNGWNNSSAIYEGVPCFGLETTLKPNAKVTWVGNVMYGPEHPSGPKRLLFDTVLTITATPKLTLNSNFDYGKEGDVKWWGVAAYAKYQATPTWDLVGRFEYLDDSKGGFMTLGQTGETVTITSDHKLPGDVMLRLEYYLNLAKNPFFNNSDGVLQKSQSTLAVGVVYAFGGKI
jgi:hypothetical protein